MQVSEIKWQITGVNTKHRNRGGHEFRRTSANGVVITPIVVHSPHQLLCRSKTIGVTRLAVDFYIYRVGEFQEYKSYCPSRQASNRHLEKIGPVYKLALLYSVECIKATYTPGIAISSLRIIHIYDDVKCKICNVVMCTCIEALCLYPIH